METVAIALADDHTLFRNALTSMINQFDHCSVICDVSNGKELIDKINAGVVPGLILLDLNMPQMTGYETADWINRHHPQILMMMLTMYETEFTMIRLLKAGVRGFLKKEITPSELKVAIRQVVETGYYYTPDTTGRMINLFRRSQEQAALVRSMLSELEIRFLRYSCSDLTYKEIANEMNLNPRAIDNIRDNLFDKLEVKSRVGLAMYAVRHCIFQV